MAVIQQQAQSVNQDQARIAQAQALAKALKSQAAGIGANPNEMVSGRVVPMSPWLALLKGVEQGVGTYQENKAAQQTADAADKRQNALIEALKTNGQADLANLATSGVDENALVNAMLKRQAGGENGPVYDFLNTDKGVLRVNKRGTDTEVLPFMIAGSSVPLQGDLMRAKEEQKISKQTLSNGQEVPMRNIDALGGAQTAPILPPQVEISPNASPQDRALLEGMAQQSGVQPNPYGYNVSPSGQKLGLSIGQSTADKAASEASAKLPYQQAQDSYKQQLSIGETAAKNQLDIEKTKNEKLAAMKLNAEQSSPLIDEAMKLLPDTVSGGVNAKINDVKEYLNIATPQGEAQSKLNAIAADLTSKVPRAPGAQSDIELKYAQQQAGNLAYASKPWQIRMSAAKYLKERNDKILKGEEVAPPQDAQQKPAVKFLGFE